MTDKRCHEDEGSGQRIYWRVRIAIEIVKGIAWAVWEEVHRGPRFPWLWSRRQAGATRVVLTLDACRSKYGVLACAGIDSGIQVEPHVQGRPHDSWQPT